MWFLRWLTQNVLHCAVCCFCRITGLLDAICLATDEPSFYSALWQCVLCSDRARLPATSYLLSKLNKKATAEDQANYLGGNLALMVLCCLLLMCIILSVAGMIAKFVILFPQKTVQRFGPSNILYTSWRMQWKLKVGWHKYLVLFPRMRCKDLVHLPS